MATPIREIAIIGAGNGGCAAAADLTLRGFSVRLYGRSASTIAPIQERGGIELSGSLGEHFAPIAKITNDAGEAMRGADLVVLMGPTHAHGAIADTIAPHIAEDQILLAAPGHTVLLIPNVLRAKGRKLPAYCDTASLPYIARKTGPAAVRIMQAGRYLVFAAFPGERTARARRALARGLSVDCARRQPAGDGFSLHQRRPSSAGDPVQCRPRGSDRRRLLPLL